eukprot:scaffold28_cov515-Prasinococcus_capsulatus_cf.AAC.10
MATYNAQERPKYVHVSSGGVTRWNRPGIDVSQEPPAVGMNEALGGILTYKLEGCGLPSLLLVLLLLTMYSITCVACARRGRDPRKRHPFHHRAPLRAD